MKFKRKGNHPVLQTELHNNKDGSVLPILKFSSLENSGMVRHGFTTRMGGISHGIYRSLNLSFTRGDDASCVRENFHRVAEALGEPEENFIFSQQTHTTNVHLVGREDAGRGLTRPLGYTDVDGLICREPHLVLCAFFADCVPLFLLDPRHRAIGLSHSGWRGTAGRMGAVTLQRMAESFGTDPGDVICAIGPSICKDCYEVSGDVAGQFEKEFPEHVREILTDKGNGKYQLDLWEANRIVFLEAGVPAENISVTDICTCCNPDLLFSHRASHGKRGNLGAFLTLI